MDLTTICRKKNLLATDSKWITELPNNLSLTVNPGIKAFLHETGKAVVSFTGEISSEELFNKINVSISQLLTQLITGESVGLGTNNITTCGPERVGVAVFFKEYTYHSEISVNSKVSWTKYQNDNPFILGSGASMVGSEIMSDRDSTALDIVNESLTWDYLSGGTIYQLDLNELGDLC